jgi:tetratricopeptide (TPR) repeat protein
MVAAYPDVYEIRRTLAGLYHNLGIHRRNLGDYDGALHALHRMTDLLEEAKSAQSQADLRVRAHLVIADTLREPWKPRRLREQPAVLREEREAVRLAEQLLATNPAVRLYQGLLAMALSRIGEQHLAEGRLGEAEPPLRRARSILEKRRLDGDRSSEGEFARALVLLGRVEGQTGREAEAARDLRTALAIWEEKTHIWSGPALGLALSWLCHSCDALAELAGTPSTRPEALGALLRVRASVAEPERQGAIRLFPLTVLTVDFHIAKLQRLSGLADAKRETIRRLEPELMRFLAEADGPWLRYEAACTYALLSTLVDQTGTEPSPVEQAEIRRYQDRAMDGLRQAVAPGSRLAEYMWQDPDLLPLHPRPDFQDLVRDRAFPAYPFAP